MTVAEDRVAEVSSDSFGGVFVVKCEDRLFRFFRFFRFLVVGVEDNFSRFLSLGATIALAVDLKRKIRNHFCNIFGIKMISSTRDYDRHIFSLPVKQITLGLDIVETQQTGKISYFVATVDLHYLFVFLRKR